MLSTTTTRFAMTILPDRQVHENVALGDLELGQGLEVLALTLTGLESLPD